MGVAVLFDCDGVLINTEEIGYTLLSKEFATYGIQYSRESFVEMLSGVTYKKFQENVKARHPELPGDFFEDFSLKMKAVQETQMKAIDGVKALLQNLKNANIPFAVCSNSSADGLLYKLKHTGLFDYFVPHIYSRDHVDTPKPAPDMFQLAARVFNVEPKDCLVVEDSITGAMAGVAADMKVIGFVGESHRDDTEAALLLKAGAKMIALNTQQVWEHITDQAKIKPQNPAPGSSLAP